MDTTLAALFSEVPAKPEHNPVKTAIERSGDRPDVAAALKLFASMPSSTAVLANPVRYHQQVAARDAMLELDIRSFTIRGQLFEEDIITGKADAIRVIFTGLFGRLPNPDEATLLAGYLATSFEAALDKPLAKAAEFMTTFPTASPDVVMQHWATFRKAHGDAGQVNASRPPAELLKDMIDVHMENVAVAAGASYMRSLASPDRERRTRQFIHDIPAGDPFRVIFSLLLRRVANADESRILGQLGAIQVHHGSAGSNMVARYFAALHTRSISDLFTASQMALDCARHFGAISDMTDFIRILEGTPPSARDEVIRSRILKGSLPTFGHPEIAAAGREHHLEADPRPALYLAPLFDAIDTGAVVVKADVKERLALMERIYQIALVEGVEKSTGKGRLRITPNTDFGAWQVQEVLGIEEPDRTLLSFVYRGFGWMMDVREQLQQPIIRPVIPPDPAIVPPPSADTTIPAVIAAVHTRLAEGDAFSPRT